MTDAPGVDAIPRLDRRQIEEFKELGCLTIPRLFDRPAIDKLVAASRRLFTGNDDTKDELGWWTAFHAFGPSKEPRTIREFRNVISKDRAFLDLTDDPRILMPMCQLLGPNIALLSSHLMLRGKSAIAPADSRKALGWHRDLGISSIEMSEPHPLLAIKVAIWLTPLAGPGEGAMRVLPGSHRLTGKPAIDPNTCQPYGATDVLAEPGDGFFFEQRLWHAGAPNFSDRPRLCLFLSYGYRWLRPQDYTVFPDEFLAGLSPIRFQLLGGAVSALGYHLPTPADLPLKAWFEKWAQIAS
jgi:ectoine hydroxylase